MSAPQAESAVLVAARQLAEEAREGRRPRRPVAVRGRPAALRTAGRADDECLTDLGIRLVETPEGR